MPNRPAAYIFALAVFAGASAAPAKSDLSDDLRSLAAPSRVGGDEELRAIERVRATPPTPGEASVWAQIANSSKYSDGRRGRAILQLFDRHVHPGMKLSELATLLGGASWLGKEDIAVFNVLGGAIPVLIVPGETVFSIVPHLTSQPSAVYLRVEGKPSSDAIYNALLGEKSELAARKITAMAISATGPDDQRLITHFAEDAMRKRYLTGPGEKK